MRTMLNVKRKLVLAVAEAIFEQAAAPRRLTGGMDAAGGDAGGTADRALRLPGPGASEDRT